MGYPKERILQAFREVSETSHDEDTYSSWLPVLCRLREEEVYGSRSESQPAREESHKITTPCDTNGKKSLCQMPLVYSILS